MRIKHVQQEKNNDCVLACVAMITGERLEDMYKKYKIDLPLSTDDMIKILTLNGFVCEKQLNSKVHTDNVYIVTVPSINIERLNHSVVFDIQDKFILHDPNKGRDGRKVYKSPNDTDKVLSWSSPIKIIDARSIKH